jgi:hypothetical protein
MEVGGQLHVQADLLLWKETSVPSNITGCLSPTVSLNVGGGGELPLLEIEPHFLGCPVTSLITVPIALSWLTLAMYLFELWAVH